MSNNDSTWTSPKTLIAFIALIVSVFGNFYQYSSSENKLVLEKEKWRHEKEKLKLENKKLQNDLESYTVIRQNQSKLKEELTQVIGDIQVWESALFKDNIELTIMKNKTSTIDNDIMKKAHLKNIELVEWKIERKEKELENSRNRKSEIERIINK
ncbi:hypothetical protein U6A24_07150 [Aquimarina gracilis]|uniref:Uncharacterized protein n=1 Tax=Aquimarina gracilis TaxID=874422 RepID=A0ABU5ZU92_9FLAO|nr:hypothetical protein [Aquimarina gracilis]MEB3345228.1 hypothetical protein [Aquimarina gracilis]